MDKNVRKQYFEKEWNKILFLRFLIFSYFFLVYHMSGMETFPNLAELPAGPLVESAALNVN